MTRDVAPATTARTAVRSIRVSARSQEQTSYSPNGGSGATTSSAYSKDLLSRKRSHLTRSAPASPYFCLRSTAARSGTRDPTAPPEKRRDKRWPSG